MPGELHQAVNSGAGSVVHRRVDPALIALNGTDDIWILPTGSVITGAWIDVVTIDTDATTPDMTLEVVDDDDGSSNAVTLAVAVDIGAKTFTAATLTSAICAPATQKRRVRAKITGEAATGGHEINVFIAATRDTTSGEPAAVNT